MYAKDNNLIKELVLDSIEQIDDYRKKKISQISICD